MFKLKNLPYLALAGLTIYADKALAITSVPQPTSIPTTFSNFNMTWQTLFRVAITVASIVFILMFLVGGVMYLTSSGNEEQAGKARGLMINAVIGLVLVLASWALGTWVLNLLGVNV